VILLATGGHGFEVLEEIEMIEVKQGPYAGDQDKDALRRNHSRAGDDRRREHRVSGFIPVNEPVLDGNEKKYLAQCIDSGWISSEGPFVRELESRFAESVGDSTALRSATARLRSTPPQQHFGLRQAMK
jgi:hypothetical protein